MIDIKRKLKNFGQLELLVICSILYVISMLTWTALTRSAVLEKSNLIKENHKQVVDFMNDQVNKCTSDENSFTAWGEKCLDTWSSDKIVLYLIENINLKNPYKIKTALIKTSSDPRIQAEGKAGQSTDKGIIFVPSSDFLSEVGSEWIIGTCIKSPCVAAGNNELISIYR